MKDITTEEAIKILKQEINTDKQNLPIAEANEYEEERQLMLSRILATEKVLDELESLQFKYRARAERLNTKIEKKDKIIDAMAEVIEECRQNDCLESEDIDLSQIAGAEAIKQYFERKIEDE